VYATYFICSVKYTETLHDTLEAALTRAQTINREYRPLYGVNVWATNGRFIAHVDAL